MTLIDPKGPHPMTQLSDRVGHAIAQALLDGTGWHGWGAVGRKAIEAMMEPTIGMIEAGWPHTADPCWESDVADAYRAMIKAALQENVHE